MVVVLADDRSGKPRQKTEMRSRRRLVLWADFPEADFCHVVTLVGSKVSQFHSNNGRNVTKWLNCPHNRV